MSEFTPTQKLSTEEQKQLPSHDQKKYILWRMEQDGEEIPNIEDGNYVIPTLGGEQGEADGALPPRQEVTQALPNTQPPDENSDLPASMKGELGNLEDPAITPPPVVEEPPVTEDPPPAIEEEKKPAEEEPPPFMQVNEQTSYNTEEEARKGFDEKDRTIKIRDEELRLAKAESELAVREAESLRRRFEAEAAAAEAAPPTAPEAAPVETPPEPTAQQLYDIYDDPDKGPLEAMKQMMPHLLQDLQPLIDMAQRMHAIKADEYIGQLQLMKTADIIQNYQEESIYGHIDSEYPEFEGKWRDASDPVGQEYAKIWKSIDQSYVEIHGASLSDISERSPESVQWAISEVLSRMSAPSENGVTTSPPATTEQVTAPPEPPLTEGTDKGEGETMLSQDEATKLAKDAAELAVEAVNTRNKLHGQTQTEASGAKTTHPATNKKRWTSEEIRKNPKGFADFARNNPNYRDATLDLLPQVRE